MCSHLPNSAQICPCAQCLPAKYTDWVVKKFCDVKDNKAFDASPTNQLAGVALTEIQESNIQALLVSIAQSCCISRTDLS